MAYVTLQRLAATVLPVLIFLTCPGVATARSCGGPIPCRCGDTVVGSMTMAADLEGCAGPFALRLIRNSSLDCAGHTISGTSSNGVKLDSATGASVRNCRITGFWRGVRIRGGDSNLVADNEFVGNDYAIDVAGGSDAGIATGHRIERNLIRDSALDGIHLSSAQGVVVAYNEIRDSGEENFYLIYSNDCTILGNTLSGGAAGEPPAA